MKIGIIVTLLLAGFLIEVSAQPITNTGPLVSLDFDESGMMDARYFASASKIGSKPEDWIVSLFVEPFGISRFVRASSTRVNFLAGEQISEVRRALTNYLPDPPRPPSENFGIALLTYRATKLEDWKYTTIDQPAFERESDLLLGMRLVLRTGNHHGWIRFTRSVVDTHTAFELEDYAVHPVPNEPIPAGQPPPLPPIQTRVESASLTFSWDTRWGPLLLESTTNLAPPISWETFVEGSGDPVAVPTLDAQRFYRLRQP